MTMRLPSFMSLDIGFSPWLFAFFVSIRYVSYLALKRYTVYFSDSRVVPFLKERYGVGQTLSGRNYSLRWPARTPRIHQAVLKAAVDLVLEIGFKALSIDAIAGRAGAFKRGCESKRDDRSALCSHLLPPADGYRTSFGRIYR